MFDASDCGTRDFTTAGCHLCGGMNGMEYILRVYNNIYLRVSVLYDGISNGVKAGSLV